MFRNERKPLRTVPCRSRPIQTSTSTSLYTTLAATTTTTTTSTTTEAATTAAEARQFMSFSTGSTTAPTMSGEATSPLASLLNGDILEQDRAPRPMAPQHDNTAEEEQDEDQDQPEHDDSDDDEQLHDELEEDDEENVVGRSSGNASSIGAIEDEHDEHEQHEDEHEEHDEQDETDDEEEQAADLHHQQALAAGQDSDAVASGLPEDIPVEQKLKQITKEIEQLSGGAGADRELRVDSRQSFLSLSDLIKNIRPAEKVVPQIDSSYANTMRVLGEPLSHAQR